MNLYDLSISYNNLVEALDNNEETEIKELIKKSMEEIETSIQDKADNIVRFIRNLDSEAKAIKEEEKRLSEKRKVIENKVKALESYLFDFVRATEKREIKGGIFTVGVKKNPPKLVIDDLKAIPSEFITTEVVETVNNADLKKALKDGQLIEGARLEQGESLKIK